MERNEQQQLQLIAEMISIARKEFEDHSFVFLLWGWSVCLIALAQFTLMELGNHPIKIFLKGVTIEMDYNNLVWFLLIPVAIVHMVYSARQGKKEKVKTHVNKIMGNVWIAVGLSFAIVLVSGWQLQLGTYPVLIMLYGIGTFISGAIMDHKVMQAGAICCWAIALVAFCVKFEYQLLLLSLSLILSYIIPGHLLQNRYKRNVQGS